MLELTEIWTHKDLKLSHSVHLNRNLLLRHNNYITLFDYYVLQNTCSCATYYKSFLLFITTLRSQFPFHPFCALRIIFGISNQLPQNFLDTLCESLNDEYPIKNSHAHIAEEEHAIGFLEHRVWVLKQRVSHKKSAKSIAKEHAIGFSAYRRLFPWEKSR